MKKTKTYNLSFWTFMFHWWLLLELICLLCANRSGTLMIMSFLCGSNLHLSFIKITRHFSCFTYLQPLLKLQETLPHSISMKRLMSFVNLVYFLIGFHFNIPSFLLTWSIHVILKNNIMVAAIIFRCLYLLHNSSGIGLSGTRSLQRKADQV